MAALAVAALPTTGCALIVDNLSEKAETEFEADLMPTIKLGTAYVQPLDIPLSLSHAAPDFTLPPEVDAQNWGPVASAHGASLRAGNKPLLTIDTSQLDYTSTTPLQVSISIQSRDGVMFSATGYNTQVSPVPACSFTLPADDGSNNATSLPLLSTAIADCFVAWTAANGVPQQFTFGISTAPVPVGTARRDDLLTEVYGLMGSVRLVANSNTEVHRFREEMTGIGKEVTENQEFLAFEQLTVTGSAKWSRTQAPPGGTGSTPCTFDPDPLIVHGSVVIGRPGQTGQTGQTGQAGKVTSASLDTTMTADKRYIYSVEYIPDEDPVVPPEIQITDQFNGITTQPPMPQWIDDTLTSVIELKTQKPTGAQANSKTYPANGFYVVAGSCPRTGDIAYFIGGLANFEAPDANDEG